MQGMKIKLTLGNTPICSLVVVITNLKSESQRDGSGTVSKANHYVGLDLNCCENFTEAPTKPFWKMRLWKTLLLTCACFCAALRTAD